MYPKELKYAKTHEWIRQEGNFAFVGITAFAIEQLTDLTYLQFDVNPGKTLVTGAVFGVVESVKGTSDLYMPVGGKIVDVHKNLTSKLELLSKEPYTNGWMIKIEPTNPAEFKTLLDAEAYDKHAKESGH